MKEVLMQLFERRPLSKEQARMVLRGIASGEHPATQVAAFVSIYRMRSITVDEFEGFREAMLELCTPVDLKGYEVLDIVGTGGDGKGTFNISTTAALVIAGAGQRVAKHGNYAASSPCGSSNVLEALGVPFRKNGDELVRDLEKAGFCFMHAPFFHPAMKNVGPIRKELAVRTFFNLLGPVTNPASPQNRVLGVCSYDLLRLYGYLMQRLAGRFVVVHSLCGYDEISLTGRWKILSNDEERVFEPRDLGLRTAAAETLECSSVEEGAARLLRILKGEGTPEENDIVAANAAFGLRCAKPELTLLDALSAARESLQSGKALRVLEALRC